MYCCIKELMFKQMIVQGNYITSLTNVPLPHSSYLNLESNRDPFFFLGGGGG